jgi:Domain of unknown function (DUF4926)
MIPELGCVALAVDLPEHGIAAGDVGAVVHVYESGKNFMVEFTKSLRLRIHQARSRHVSALAL